MAKCDFCGKGVSFGCKVSHSMRHSNRTWKARIRLHPLPAFRQGDAGRLKCVP